MKKSQLARIDAVVTGLQGSIESMTVYLEKGGVPDIADVDNIVNVMTAMRDTLKGVIDEG